MNLPTLPEMAALVPRAVDWGIVAEAGIRIDWRQHARAGIPVTLGSLALLWAWWGWAPSM